MIQTPSQEDIINSFVENIRSTIPELSTTPVSVVREALINPSSTQISFIFDLAKRISILQDVFQATGTDLNALAATYQLTRRAGSAASGILYLDLTQLESIDTITVNSGSTVRPQQSGSNTSSFNIIGNFTFTATDRAVYEANANRIRDQLDSIGLTSVRLVAPVPITASASGTSGNIGAYTLRNVNIPNITNAVNVSPTSGGTPAESDDSLRRRIVATFTGNSTGSEAGLLAAVTSVDTVTGSFLVRFGDPLMTRDGSVYDEQGNLITPGTGRAVDIYVQGESLATNSETSVFTISDTENFLSVGNKVLIGQPVEGNFGNLPATLVTSITGSESTATFSQGVEVIDEEGNRLIEGNFTLIKDIEADNFLIVEDLITRERKLATSLNPSSTKYTVITELSSTDFANSSLSQDSILFLKNTVDVSEETLTKGSFNGAEQLRFSNVSQVVETYEERSITDTIRIESTTETTGGVLITLPHSPVISISSIFHSRLGINIDFEIVDSENGIIRLISRTPPRAGDILLVDLVWKKIYQQNLNYNLAGDLIDWIASADEKNRTDDVLLSEQDLESETSLALQPNISSELIFSLTGLSDRQIIDTTITGTTTSIINNQLALSAEDPFTFAITGTSNIGRIFRVTNTTKGFDYNLTGYKLKNNKLDPTAGVESSLLSQQFLLNERANTDLIEVGDKVVLGRPSRTLSWSSQSDFQNNIEDNLTPVYDPTTLSFTPGGVILQTPLLDQTTTATSLSGIIAQDTTLSGIIEVVGELIIAEGVVVTILPGTTIKVRPAEQLENQITFAQRLRFDQDLNQQDTLGNTPTATDFEDFQYLYFQPENFNSSSFTIVNDQGEILSIRFEQDVLSKVISNSTIQFFVNGRAVDSSFNSEIESTLDLNDVTSSIKATLLGGRSGVDGAAKFTAAKIIDSNRYYILLERDPITTANVQNDFSLYVEADSSVRFDRFSYNQPINALVVDGDILEIDGYGDTTSATDYIVSHFIEQQQRVAIVVEGSLIADGNTPQTSILFTSAATTASPGDWEGIVFTSKSSTNNTRTVQPSILSNARVQYSNVGVSIDSSDPTIQNCVIRDALATGINISSSNNSISQFTTDDFDLVVVGDPFAKFQSESRLGFSSTDDVQVARYSIPDNLVTGSGKLPPVGTKLTNTRYIVDMIESVDYSVFIDGQSITSLDTSLPPDGYADYSLEYGRDFFIEFDINQGYSLSFIYTAGSQKRRKVYDLVVDLNAALSSGKITVDYFNSVANGVVFDNLIINTDVGIIADTLATTSINRNTIDNTRLGVVASEAIFDLRNNLITDYSSAPLAFGSTCLVRAQRNNIYSQTIVDQEQTGLADTDLLLRNISAISTSLAVRSPAKFKVSQTLKLADEEMLVQAVSDDSVTVSRGQNGTTATSHPSGTSIELLQLNQIFTVTGVAGDSCQLIETDQFGTQLPNTVPIQMRLVGQNSFRVAFPLNRRADFYYKYRFTNQGSSITNQTLTKVFPKEQFGVGVNDVVSLLHEIPLDSVIFTPNNENYSADPLYTNPPSADFSYSALQSLASKSNPIYGSLVVPQSNHKYVGFIDVSLVRGLGVGETRIPVPSETLIVSSFDEVEILGIDSLNQGIRLTIKEFSFNITAEEANQGAIGVLVLDETIHPTGVPIAGDYSVAYDRPIDLGTTIPPYYIESDISYVIDAGAEVTFNTVEFEKDQFGGQVEFTFQVADSVSNLPLVIPGTPASSSPILIEQVSTTNIGRAIQINVKLKGNDSSFSPSLEVLFPILESFSLNYLPAKDSIEYGIISLVKNTVQNETNLLIDRPITTDSFEVVGSDDTLDLFVRKKSDNFDPSQEFLLATTQAISPGDTFIVANGDLTIRKADSDPSDIIRVDYLSFNQGQSETLVTVQDGSQTTTNSFSQVDTISHKIVQDRDTVLPSTQTISVSGLSQPSTGSDYLSSYAFQAPLDGETLTISFNYNSTIKEAQEEVEIKKSLFTDALVKQVRNVPIRVAIALEVVAGEPALSVQSEVGAAISNLFSTTFSDITTERRLDASDIIRATGNISGIEDIRVTTLSSNLLTGEVEDPVTIQRRESASLEEGSPRINTTQNGQTVAGGS